jgi:hypothetical protein
MRVNAFGLAAGWKLCAKMRLSGFTTHDLPGSKLETQKVEVDVRGVAAPELSPDSRMLVLIIDAVHLKDVLGGIQTDSDNRHGTAPLAALHTSQPGTTDAVGGRPPQHHDSSPSVVPGRTGGFDSMPTFGRRQSH